MQILAIDPGNEESGMALIEAGTCQPLAQYKWPNGDLLKYLESRARTGEETLYAIEMIESFGMAVAHSVFQSCWWGGRFQQACPDPEAVHLITRKTVKRAICHNIHAKDPNITQALADRFAPNVRNKGKGSKAEPGWFYGFAGDMWAAYAVAVTLNDQLADQP